MDGYSGVENKGPEVFSDRKRGTTQLNGQCVSRARRPRMGLKTISGFVLSGSEFTVTNVSGLVSVRNWMEWQPAHHTGKASGTSAAMNRRTLKSGPSTYAIAKISP
jgi:hypothetical protein